MVFQKIGGRLVDAIFGYDFFISYTWADGSKYAHSLYEKLKAQGFTVFLDEEEYARGDNWTLLGRRALKKTRQLILVATPRVHQSAPVLKELTAFASTGRRVVPVEIGDGLNPQKYPESPLLALIPAEVLRISQPLEETGAIPTEAPAEVVRELRRGFQHVRQTQLRVRFLLGACLVLLGLLTFAVWQGFRAELQRKNAVKQEALAKDQTQVANHARADAVEAAQQTRLRASKADADIAVQLAGRGDEANAFAHAVRALDVNPKNTIASILAYRLLGDGPLTLPSCLLTHSSIVRALAFSRDGQMVASGCDDGSVAVTDLKTNERFILSDKSLASVVKLAFSPDGQLLAFATGSEAGQKPAVHNWQYKTQQKPVLVSEDFTWEILELSWPLDDRIVAYSGRDWGSGDQLTQVFGLTPKGWEVVFGIHDRLNADEKPRPHVLEIGGSFVTWVAEDIASLVIHDRVKQRVLWLDLHGTPNINKPLFVVNTGPADIVEVARGTGVAVIGSNFTKRFGIRRLADDIDPQRQSAFRCVDPRSRAQKIIKLPKDTVLDQISADGKRLLALKANRTVVVLDRNNGEELASLAVTTNDPGDLLTLTEDGKSLIVRSQSNGAILANLDKEEGVRQRRISVPTRVTDAHFDPAGMWFALSSDDKDVRVWSRAALTERPVSLSTIASKNSSSNQIKTDKSLQDSDAKCDLSNLEDTEQLEVYRTDPKNGQRMHVSTLQKIDGIEEAMTGYAFSPDCSRVVVSYGNMSSRPDANLPSAAVLFDAASGAMIGKPLHHDDDVFSPSYAPNGRWFITVSDDRTVRQWDGQSGAPIGEPLRLPSSQRFAQVSPNSTFIVTGTGQIIDVAKWQAIKKLAPSPVWVFAHAFFSPDGSWLATISENWEPTGESPSFVELNQWDLQNAVRISDPIEVSLGRQLPQTGYAANWLEPGRRVLIASDLAWQCTLPCTVESILPFLHACRPLILGETGEQTINNNCSLESINLNSFFPQGRTKENQAAYDLAERVLKRSGNALHHSDRLSP